MDRTLGNRLTHVTVGGQWIPFIFRTRTRSSGTIEYEAMIDMWAITSRLTHTRLLAATVV